jgi:quercetin dioxygenase-like cupin family protein
MTDSLRANDGVFNLEFSPEFVQQFSQGGLTTLEQVAQFNPEGYVKRSIFKTDSLHFGLYCLEPGQINARHKHPQNDEICYVVQGTGEIVIGDEIAAVEAGVFIHAHQSVEHEIRNTGTERMLIIVVQSPLPLKTER